MRQQTNSRKRTARLGLLYLMLGFTSALYPQPLPAQENTVSESHAAIVGGSVRVNASSNGAVGDVRVPAVPQKQSSQACPQAASFQQEEIMDNREVQIASLALFFVTGSLARERSMWVTFKNGQFGFVRWPSSAATNADTWRGPLPECTAANVHTHPMGASEEPAFIDHELADGHQLPSVRLPVYVLHRNGIWKAVPGNPRAVQVRDINWIREFGAQQGKLKNHPHSTPSTAGRK
ncbi:MAG: hypothetical protein ACLGRW_12400 [Acidobacteriota bacterium]